MKRTVLLLSIFALIFSGCIKKGDLNFNNLQITNWTPDWAFPLINTKLSMKDLIKTNNLLTTDSTGLYSVHYDAQPFTFRAGDFINIPDQRFSKGFGLSIPISLPVLPTDSALHDSIASSYNFTDTAGAQLQHLILKSGSFQVTITSTFNQNVGMQLTFPNIKKNGTPLIIPVYIYYPSNSNTNTIDLSGYTLDLTNGGSSSNYLGYKINYSLVGSGQPISPTDSITASLNLSNLKFSFLDGKLGHYTIPIPVDSVDVSLFNKTISANLFLKNPLFHLTFNNSFGIGLTARFDTMFGVTQTGTVINMPMPPMNIAAANTPGQVQTSYFTVDSTNSRIQYLLNPAPNVIYYQGKIIIDPGTSTYNFVYDTSSIGIAADAELPACFKILSFSLQDTIKKLLMPGDTSMLNKVEFAMQVTNSFPLYGNLQLFLCDSNYVVLDSLVSSASSNYLIPMAPVDANGIVNGVNTTVVHFVYDHDRYHRIASRIAHGLARGYLSSSGTNTVQIHTSDYLQLKLAFRFALNVSFVGF